MPSVQYRCRAGTRHDFPVGGVLLGFEAGQVVGDYEILEAIGSGGMGHVYRVRNVISNRVEALKALQPAMMAEPDFSARFSAEIRTLAAFDHPNIAQLRTAFQFNGEQLMVMEFVEGSTLDKLARGGAMPASEVVPIVLQVLSALSYAHGRGVVHRDIKPANIMVTARGNVKLMDFGIAKSASENQMTQPGSTFGSFYYMSPEQVRGGAVDGRSDIYSVGVVLYELLTGRRPFQADNTFELLNQHLNENPQPPVAINPQVPQALNDLVLMAMSKEPAGRFQSADAFAKALQSVSATAVMTAPMPAAHTADRVSQAAPVSQSVRSVPPPSTAGMQQAISRKPNRTLWVVAGALAVVVVFIAALTIGSRFFKSSAGSKGAVPRSAAQTAATPPAAGSAKVDSAQQQPAATAAATPASAPAPSAGERAEPPAKPLQVAKSAPARRAASYPPLAEEQTPAQQPAAAMPLAPSVQPAEPAGPSNEEIENAQDDLIKLNSRASAVAGSVEHLQQQQAADGLGLRQDMAGAYSRMNAYLHAAESDIAEKNLAALHRHMDLAEKEISTLEKFFNK